MVWFLNPSPLIWIKGAFKMNVLEGLKICCRFLSNIVVTRIDLNPPVWLDGFSSWDCDPSGFISSRYWPIHLSRRRVVLEIMDEKVTALLPEADEMDRVGKAASDQAPSALRIRVWIPRVFPFPHSFRRMSHIRIRNEYSVLFQLPFCICSECYSS